MNAWNAELDECREQITELAELISNELLPNDIDAITKAYTTPVAYIQAMIQNLDIAKLLQKQEETLEDDQYQDDCIEDDNYLDDYGEDQYMGFSSDDY